MGTSQSPEMIRDQLRVQQQALQPMVAETGRVIGHAARDGYEWMRNIAGVQFGEPNISVVQDASLVIGTLYQVEHQIAGFRQTLPGCEVYGVESAGIQRRERRVSLFGRTMKLCEAEPSAVYVETHKLSAEDAYVRRPPHARFRINQHGAAFFNESRKHTRPLKTIGRPQDYAMRSADVLYYTSPDELREDYAAQYTGALAVTSMVVTGINLSHGVEIDQAPILQLMDRWQQVSETSQGILSDSLKRVVPFALALRGGVTLHT